MEPLIKESYLVPLIYNCLVTCLCGFFFLKLNMSYSCDMLLKKMSPFYAVVLSAIFIVLLGIRGDDYRYFGDSPVYRYNYEFIISNDYLNIDWNKEWFYRMICTWCKRMGLNYVGYFLVVEIGYIGLMFLAYKKLLWENVLLAMLFAFGAFSFWGGAVNGLRNGLACSFLLFAMALIVNRKVVMLPIGIGLCVLAMGIHRSTVLPICMFFVSMYVVKKVKWAVWFWVVSIVISLIMGDRMIEYFVGLGFDDRMDKYLNANVSEDVFSHTGFRWDFLLYSSMPVLFSWYVVERKGIKDKVFNVLSCTYILSNAFWVMVNSASFSNRFAYLSWFMYPLILAYASIRLPIWKDQDRKAGWILFAQSVFTMFMFIISQLRNGS